MSNVLVLFLKFELEAPWASLFVNSFSVFTVNRIWQNPCINPRLQHLLEQDGNGEDSIVGGFQSANPRLLLISFLSMGFFKESVKVT